MESSAKHEPPKWIKKLLSRLLTPRLLEASLGDLEEKFQQRLHKSYSPWKAKLLYSLEALGFLKLASRSTDASTQTTINMISHTFLFFSRLVRKDWSYYLVSLLGLTLSLTSFILIMMFVRDELAYDQFHEKKERICRVTTHLQINEVVYKQAKTYFPLAGAIRTEFGDVEEAVRIFPQDLTLEYGDKKFEEHIVFTDDNFFNVFSFPVIYGEARTMMTEPASVILTQRTSIKYFGSGNPVGKSLLLNGQTLAVTAVVQDVPEQSHLQFDAVIPLQLQLNVWKSETGLEGRENKWFWTGAYTYLLLKPGMNVVEMEGKLPLIVNKYFPERYREHGKLEVQSLTDIHLKSTFSTEIETSGSMMYVRFFSIVAFVIMIVSAINLVNLSWFKISSRIREVGIRKFLGQNAARIITQLSIESMLIGVLAFVLAIVMCQFFLINFNLLVQKNLDLWTASNLMIAGGTLAMIIVVCLIAVIRPAYRYATRSSSYLLFQKYTGRSTARLRNILIGLQVCFSFVLLVFSFVISSQIDFFKNKDLGFEKKNIVVVDLNEDIYPKLEAFKNELKKGKDIVEVSGGAVPGKGYDGWRFVPEGGSYEKPFLFPVAWCDYNFISTMKIKLLIGENFDPNNNYDSLWPFIINKRAAIELGWMDDPLNRTMEIFAPGTTEIMAKGKVIGVIDDYHFTSLHKPINPVVLTVAPYFGTALVKISDNSSGAIPYIEETWKKFSGKPFAYEMLDKKLEKFYTNEDKLSNVILFFTFIALYLTCYGMFAMSSLLFSSRLKEVAIRKVFGADQFSIIRRFYSRYAAFNFAAIVVGLPIAIYVGNLWLQTFQYRISLDSTFFIKAGVCILIAGLLSVSYYLAKVAFSNPVKFLRSE